MKNIVHILFIALGLPALAIANPLEGTHVGQSGCGLSLAIKNKQAYFAFHRRGFTCDVKAKASDFTKQYKKGRGTIIVRGKPFKNFFRPCYFKIHLNKQYTKITQVEALEVGVWGWLGGSYIGFHKRCYF